MPNIKNISSLRQYTAVLDEVHKGQPVYLTRDGKGQYAIVDLAEYDELREALWDRFYNDLDIAISQGDDQGWISLSDVKAQVKSHGRS